MSEDNRLGAHLRARRELVRPEDVGLPTTGVRRVPGLRREEVALLAGVSADYYLRLEQGRDRNPSPQVLESIARVLQVGSLTLHRQKFTLSDGSGLILGTYHAEPGSESAEKLALLASLGTGTEGINLR